MSLCLSLPDVVELTGARRRSAQFAWFRARGIPVEEGRDGRPKVLRAAVDARMMPKDAHRSRAKTAPDLEALPRGKAA